MSRSCFRAPRRVLGAIVLAVAGAAVRAQPPAPPGPGPRRADAFDGAALAARVDPLFAACDRPGSPGAAVGVLRGGRVLWARGYGQANLEHGIPNTPRTVFDIGSTSKQFTAACAVLLEMDGRLSLDDDLRKHVPEMPDYGRTIRLRDLLHHASGIRDYCALFGLSGVADEDFTTREDALALIARQRALCFPPGERHEYSNSGYFLLSVVIERVCGRSLDAFAQERIFGPLGMADTHIHDDHTRIVPRRATGYRPGEGGGFAICMSDFEQTGDGSVMTTVEDLAKWADNFWTGRVGGPRFLEAMASRGRLASGATLDYGCGLMFGELRGIAIVSHGGAWAGYRAELLRVPGKDFAVACLCNLGSLDPSGLARRVAEAVLDLEAAAPETATPGPAASAAKAVAPAGIPVPAPDVPGPEVLAAWVGSWRDPAMGRRVEIKLAGSGLVLAGRAGEVPLTAVSGDRFRAEEASLDVVFEPATDSRRPRMKLVQAGRPEMVLEPYTPWRPSAVALGPFAGGYESPELGATWDIVIESGSLRVRAKRASGTMEPTCEDAFECFGLTLAFTRDASGVPVSFTIRTRGIEGLVFSRKR